MKARRHKNKRIEESFVNNHILLSREAPRLEIYPSTTQTVAKGGSVLFQCRVLAGIPAPEVSQIFLFSSTIDNI